MSGYIMDLRKIVGHRPLLQAGASVILENKKGEVLLQQREDTHEWGYHGGSVELDENIEEAARRELLEETGLTANRMELLGFFSGPEMHYVYPNGDEVSNCDHVYVCSDYSGELLRQESEVNDLKFFSINHLPERMFTANLPAMTEYIRRKKDVRAVVFDMDGVIFDSERLVIECWKEVAGKYQIPDVETTLMKCLGVTREKTRQIFEERYGADFPYEAYKKEQSDLFFFKYGEGRLPVKKGVRELLRALKEHSIPVALASSTRREVVEQELKDAGIYDYFSAVVCGDMVSRSKPHPEIFLRACMELGVKPAQSLAVEDSYNGIRSASAGGLRTCMVPDLLEADEEIAGLCEFIFDDLDQLAVFLFGEQTRDRLRPQCIACLAGKYPNRYPEHADASQIREFQRRVLMTIASADRREAAPVVTRDINDIREELFGERICYSNVKHHFNQLMLGLEEELWQRLAQSEDPLALALQYSILSNYIDFGALSNVDEDFILDALNRTEDYPLPKETYTRLWEDLSRAKRILILLDNCGEIVMDKLLIRVIRRLYPEVKVTAMVRGAETQNDVTLADAKETGLDLLAEIISNGNNIAGTCEKELSPEAMAALNRADLILSKGQANFETMRWCGRNVYYGFLCKCQMLAQIFKVPLFTLMLVHEDEASRIERG